MKHLRIEHFDSDFGGGVDGPQVGQQCISTEDGAACAPLTGAIRRLDENLMGRTGSFAQRPPHVGQLLLQTATLCEKTHNQEDQDIISHENNSISPRADVFSPGQTIEPSFFSAAISLDFSLLTIPSPPSSPEKIITGSLGSTIFFFQHTHTHTHTTQCLKRKR